MPCVSVASPRMHDSRVPGRMGNDEKSVGVSRVCALWEGDTRGAHLGMHEGVLDEVADISEHVIDATEIRVKYSSRSDYGSSFCSRACVASRISHPLQALGFSFRVLALLFVRPRTRRALILQLRCIRIIAGLFGLCLWRGGRLGSACVTTATKGLGRRLHTRPGSRRLHSSGIHRYRVICYRTGTVATQRASGCRGLGS